MKLFIALLLCLFCLAGCGYSLQGSWKGGPEEKVKMEFRSDGSILEQGQKAELLTWHGDYISLNTKKIRDAQAESLAQEKQRLLDDGERNKKQLLDNAEHQKKQLHSQANAEQPRTGRYKGDTVSPTEARNKMKEWLENQLKQNEEQLENQLKRNEERLQNQLKQIDAQLEQIKNGKGLGWNQFSGMRVDKKDISESADKVEARIHWVDNDHFDLGSTSFTRVKEKN